jgi:hypothetical protein
MTYGVLSFKVVVVVMSKPEAVGVAYLSMRLRNRLRDWRRYTSPQPRRRLPALRAKAPTTGLSRSATIGIRPPASGTKPLQLIHLLTTCPPTT